MSKRIDLLGSGGLVEVPFVKVDIGEYTFGVYQKSKYINNTLIKYPDYIKSLKIDKVNGAVNTYELNIIYPITTESDPNFFDKVFSSVSDTRRIVFSYGDFSTPDFIYSNEEAIITDLTIKPSMKSSYISYVVKAVSDSTITYGAKYSFPATKSKPSTVIFDLMYKNGDRYKIKDIFRGMQNEETVRSKGLIATDDKEVSIPMKTNISILEYLEYLVSCMATGSDNSSGTSRTSFYTMDMMEDTTGELGGPYFVVKKVNRSSNSLESACSYLIDIGYPNSTPVIDFELEDSQGYAILYKYNQSINSYNYGKRIDDNGNVSYVYAPPLTSSTQLHKLTEQDRTWWTKMTEFPIKAKLVIKGVLRPQLLMSYVKINVWYYGRKHSSSGYYIITAQEDNISEAGFRTTLSLTRVAGDDEGDYLTSVSTSSTVSTNAKLIEGINNTPTAVTTASVTNKNRIGGIKFGTRI